jgi:hypothetical protein
MEDHEDHMVKEDAGRKLLTRRPGEELKEYLERLKTLNPADLSLEQRIAREMLIWGARYTLSPPAGQPGL